jgi:hypothetical protein
LARPEFKKVRRRSSQGRKIMRRASVAGRKDSGRLREVDEKER